MSGVVWWAWLLTALFGPSIPCLILIREHELDEAAADADEPALEAWLAALRATADPVDTAE